MVFHYINQASRIRSLCVLVTLLLMIGVSCQQSSPTEEISPILTPGIGLPEKTQPQPVPSMKAVEITPGIEQTQVGWANTAVDESRSEQAVYAVGEPDAEGCDLSNVWVYPSVFYPNASDYLQLFYIDPLIPTQVNIHLAYSYNAIVRVSLIDLSGNPHEIYEGTPAPLEDCPFVLTINVTDMDDPVYAVRLDFDTLFPEEEGNLTAVDAVELVGRPLTTSAPTPVPTPYLTLSSLGFNASQVAEGFVYFEIFDKNTNETLTTTECDAFSYNLMDAERTIKFFSCDDQTEIWLYLPLELSIGELPLNTYPTVPTARLFYEDRYIPAMEGTFWVDMIDETSITGVLEFAGFDPENAGAYYGAVAVLNQIPIDDEAAQKPGDMIVQWAETASASSELSADENAAHQAAGPSDTWENCENAVTAWKPDPSDEQPWIELYFKEPIQPTTLNILFTSNPESVEAVNLLSETDFFPLDLSSVRILEGCPTALTFDPLVDMWPDIIGVQIIFEEGNGNLQPGIDAVQIIGIISE